MPIDEDARNQVRQWIAVHAATAFRHRRESAVEEIYINRMPAHAVGANDLEGLYDRALGVIGDSPVTYLEFGVFGGRSMQRMLSRFRHPDARFYGFDSFEGLPEQWNDMAPGTFSRRGRIPEIVDPRVRFVKGWFQNTLPEFLEATYTPAWAPILVHYDADLYSATLFIMSTLWHYIPAYYFIFDEFMSEEIVAMHNFIQAYPVEFELLSQTNSGGYPTQVFGHLRRTAFLPRPVASA